MRAKVWTGLLVVFVCLLLGAATTYLSARVLMNRATPPGPGRGSILFTEAEGWHVYMEELPGCSVCRSTGLTPHARGVICQTTGLPTWSVVNGRSPAEVGGSPSVRQLWIWEAIAGWPCRAVFERQLWELPSQGVGGPVITRRVRPLWPGCAVNTLLFDAAWIVVLGASAKLIRACRRRPGCCRRCGYDLSGLRGDVCPECGNAVTDRPPSKAADESP